MTLEKTLSNVALEAAKHADLANQLIEGVKDGIDTIEVVSQNHSVMDDWRTKTGKVVFKDLAGNTHQVDTLATIIADAEKINPNPHVMTKAQFDALRDIRKKQYAGSGFVEWGKHIITSSEEPINQGLYTTNVLPNQMRLGRGTADNGIGKSSTDSAVVVVDGIEHSIDAGFDHKITTLHFPSAPDGTKTYDSATGVVTEHASAAEAFGGGVLKEPHFNTDGTIDADTQPWAALAPDRGTATKSGGKVTIVDENATSAVMYITQELVLEANETYKLGYHLESITGGGATNFIQNISTQNVIASFPKHVAGASGFFEVEITPTEQTSVRFLMYAGNNGQAVYTESYVRKSTEQVITSRKDLVFLESWHEKIADKDVVYPLGNVQYGATSYDGIGLLNNLVAQGYSAFGEWDANTTGHGAKWSSLSEVNRAKLLANPAHNIYYDPEAKAYIQVRYRIRVVEGLGDEWINLYPTGRYSNVTEWSRYGFSSSKRITFVQGNATSISTKVFLSKDHAGSLETKSDKGIAEAETFHYSINSKVMGVPIALVQRMNQGAYHPSYNPMGCARAIVADGGSARYWSDNLARYITSSSEAFTYPTSGYPYTDGFAYPDTGLIGGVNDYSGRQDQYKYYDAIYAGQVEDLRLNVNKLDVNQLREETMRKAVAGTLRGKGKSIFTHFKSLKSGYYRASNQWNASLYDSPQDGSPLDFFGNDFPASTSVIVWQPATKTTLYGTISTSNGHMRLTQQPNNLGGIKHVNPLGNTGLNNTDICYFAELTNMSPEFDSLPWVDIIGNPERIAATFPDGVVGQWIPQIPDGSATNYSLNRKSVNSSDIEPKYTYTVDDGSSWIATAFPNTAWSPRLNAIVGVSRATSEVGLLYYESPSDFTELNSNSVVLGDVGKVHTSADNFVSQSNRLTPSLIGKIGKDNQDGSQLRSNSVTNAPLTSYSKLWNSNKVTHNPITLRKPINDSPAVKALPTVTEKGGLLYLQFHGAELKYDTPTIVQITLNNSEIKATKGTIYRVASDVNSPLAGGVWYCNASTSAAFDDITWSKNSDGNIRAGASVSDPNIYFIPHYVAGWGDDQTIPIVNGEDVKTDLNGNTVKVFCHHTQIPIGIAHPG